MTPDQRPGYPNPLTTGDRGPAPLVSIVIPAFNASGTIRETVSSVLAQTLSAWELVVVDDGSTDGTARIVTSEFSTHGDKIRVVSTPNQGVSHARNLGVSLSTAPLLAFLDSDDLWEPQKLELQIGALNLAGGLRACACDFLIVGGDRRATGKYVSVNWTKEGILQWLLVEGPGVLLPSTLMITRSAFEDLGGFDVRLSTAADLDLAYRLVSTTDVEVLPVALVMYRLSQGQMHTNIDMLLRDYEILFDKDPFTGNSGLVTRTRVHIDLLGLEQSLKRGNFGRALHHLVASVIRHPLLSSRRLTAKFCQIGRT